MGPSGRDFKILLLDIYPCSSTGRTLGDEPRRICTFESCQGYKSIGGRISDAVACKAIFRQVQILSDALNGRYLNGEEAVLKTVSPQGPESSNPSPSAHGPLVLMIKLLFCTEGLRVRFSYGPPCLVDRTVKMTDCQSVNRGFNSPTGRKMVR